MQSFRIDHSVAVRSWRLKNVRHADLVFFSRQGAKLAKYSVDGLHEYPLRTLRLCERKAKSITLAESAGAAGKLLACSEEKNFLCELSVLA